MFVPGKPWQRSLTFVGENSRRPKCEAPERCSTLE